MTEVKNIMTRKVICIEKDHPVVDAIRIMLTKKITGIPVCTSSATMRQIYF